MNNSFVSGLKEYREIIDDFINGQKLMNIIALNNKFEHMKKYLTAFQNFSMCGKRIRAYLVKLGYEMCGGENIDDIILPSLSYEMFQSGVLIQDDVIDLQCTYYWEIIILLFQNQFVWAIWDY